MGASVKQHNLKIWPVYFKAVLDGNKRFEIRDNTDRDFKVGDIVHLQEWDPVTKEYTSAKMYRRITHVTDFMQQPGYVVFGMAGQ